MTPEAKAKYLANPDHCPFCGEKDRATYATAEIMNDETWNGVVCAVKVECENCSKCFQEIYTLTDVEEIA